MIFLYIRNINQSIKKMDFLYTCETPNKFIGGDVHSNDLETIEDYAIECGQEYGYSIVRNNVTGEIVFEHGDQLMELIEQGII